MKKFKNFHVKKSKEIPNPKKSEGSSRSEDPAKPSNKAKPSSLRPTTVWVQEPMFHTNKIRKDPYSDSSSMRIVKMPAAAISLQWSKRDMIPPLTSLGKPDKSLYYDKSHAKKWYVT